MSAIDQQITRATDAFVAAFGRSPRFAAIAPGRVNLIGEHTDYNDGFVLPMAIERQTVIVADRAPGGPRPANAARIISTAEDQPASFAVDASLKPGDPKWSNYVRGVVAGFVHQGVMANGGGFDAAIDSTVPIGGGLSSSASLEVAAATLLEALTGHTMDPVDKALLCQKAEHEFAGMPCGIMDQFISTMGKADHAMLLDCRTRQPRMVKLGDPSLAVLIVNSNVKHELTGGEYAERRAQCEAAARALGVPALRDATMTMLEGVKGSIDAVTYLRARHVITENERTLQAAAAMESGDWPTVGQLMLASHASMRDDFEITTPELDALVDMAMAFNQQRAGAVIGSRMTGGGFGGCTVSLVKVDHVDELSAALHDRYLADFGIATTSFATRPADGARVVAL